LGSPIAGEQSLFFFPETRAVPLPAVGRELPSEEVCGLLQIYTSVFFFPEQSLLEEISIFL